MERFKGTAGLKRHLRSAGFDVTSVKMGTGTACYWVKVHVNQRYPGAWNQTYSEVNAMAEKYLGHEHVNVNVDC